MTPVHWELTARKMITDGSFMATEYLRACLDRIAERETDVGAWTYVARGSALAQAAADRQIGIELRGLIERRTAAGYVMHGNQQRPSGIGQNAPVVAVENESPTGILFGFF
jgi:hypothetical protein